MSKRPLSDSQLGEVARLFAALAEPTRLRLLQILQDGPRTVSGLVAASGARQANVSKQLGILHGAGLVARRRNGISILYSVRDPLVFELCALVCGKVRRDARDKARALGA